MLSIARKSLSSLFSNPNSFLCISSLHPFLSNSIIPFSTSTIKALAPNPEICDVLVNKHNFSPESASLASSSYKNDRRSPKSADSVLSFLKGHSFTTAQLQKIVMYNPRILGFTTEALQSKLKVFQDLGLSSEEIANIMVQNTAILHSNMAKRIIPNLSILKGFLGSNNDVALVLKRPSWILTFDLEKCFMPNVKILKSIGIQMEGIRRFICANRGGFLLARPDVLRKSVDKAVEYGFSRNSNLLLQAAHVLAYTSKGAWEGKLQTLRDLGFSDSDIFDMFRKQPMIFLFSQKKFKRVVELLLGTGKYNISDIASIPSLVAYSIEKRLEPRLQILELLESLNLIEKWPGLSAVSKFKDDKFFNRFVRPYYDEIGEEDIIKKYVEGKKGLKLCPDRQDKKKHQGTKMYTVNHQELRLQLNNRPQHN